MRTDGARSASLELFLAAVVVVGAAVIVQSILALRSELLTGYALLLAALTIAGGRFSIPIPGRQATVSVSEVFVFSSVLLFGPAVPVLTVALDGLYISVTQKNRRLYRTVFNVAEPAISTWTAAYAFFAVAGVAPGAPLSTAMPVLVPAAIAMAGVFFLSNGGLTAVAVALEAGASPVEVWRSHAWYLAVNYHAAASIATLAVSSGAQINFAVVGLVGPLLVLSYVAFREASTRAGETERHIGDVERLYRASVEMLAIAVDAKDQVTHGHIRRVQRHTLSVAASMGVTDARELKAMEAGALLHDIGKLAVPDYVLAKPSALTPAEFETMKKHASMGARILTAVDFPYPIVPIVRHHHEQWDGGGYPDGLVGGEIPLGARILAVVDCFDALTSDRPYRPRLSDEQAIGILQSRRGTHYDPGIVDRFIELVPELRRSDEASGEPCDAQASVVAGLSRLPARDLAASAAARPPIAIPVGAQRLVDDFVAALPGADACVFALDGGHEALLVAHATRRISAVVADFAVAIGSGVSGWVAANRSVIRRADPVLDLGAIAHDLNLRTCVSAPIFVRSELFGALTVYVAEAPALDDIAADVGLLAQEVGLAIARGTTPRHLHVRGAGPAPVAAAS